MSNLPAEHLTGYHAAKKAVAFYIPPVAVLRARGADRIDLLNRLSTNELKQLQPHQGARTVLTNEKGRIIDVLTVLAGDQEALLMCSANNQSPVIQWLKKYTIMDDCKISDASAEYFALEILGPESTDLLSSLAGEVILELPMSHWQSVDIFGLKATLIRQPALCEFSFLVLFDVHAKDAVLSACQALSESVPTINSEVHEVIRIEAGSGTFGTELTEKYNPLEAGLLHLINFKKGCYIGQEVIARIDSYNKVKQRLMGFVSTDEMFSGSEILVDDTLVGTLTSVTQSPDFGSIAVGFIRGEYAHQYSSVQIKSGDRQSTAEIRPLPFE